LRANPGIVLDTYFPINGAGSGSGFSPTFASGKQAADPRVHAGKIGRLIFKGFPLGKSKQGPVLMTRGGARQTFLSIAFRCGLEVDDC